MPLIGENGQLFGLSQQTWLILDQLGILLGVGLGFISFLGLAWAYIKKDRIRYWFLRNHFPESGDEVDDKNVDGLIFTLSRSEVPIWMCSQFHPKWVGIVVTEHSRDEADKLILWLKKNDIAYSERLLQDTNNLSQIRKLTRELIEQAREQDLSSLALDITGGKVTMSLGAFMEGEENQVPSWYVSTELKNRKPYLPSAKVIEMSQATG